MESSAFPNWLVSTNHDTAIFWPTIELAHSACYDDNNDEEDDDGKGKVVK